MLAEILRKSKNNVIFGDKKGNESFKTYFSQEFLIREIFGSELALIVIRSKEEEKLFSYPIKGLMSLDNKSR